MHYKVGYARVRCPLSKWGEEEKQDIPQDVIPGTLVRRSFKQPRIKMPKGINNGR
jgi:hypothetical protein